MPNLAPARSHVLPAGHADSEFANGSPSLSCAIPGVAQWSYAQLHPVAIQISTVARCPEETKSFSSDITSSAVLQTSGLAVARQYPEISSPRSGWVGQGISMPAGRSGHHRAVGQPHRAMPSKLPGAQADEDQHGEFRRRGAVLAGSRSAVIRRSWLAITRRAAGDATGGLQALG